MAPFWLVMGEVSCELLDVRARQGKAPPRRIRSQILPIDLFGFFCWAQDALQFFEGNPPRPIELQGFPLPLSRLAAGPQHQQHGGNQRAIDLERHPRLRFRQPVATAQNAFDPLEE
jgi:hypothetical protein